ncbi:MAG: ABC transporter ATP-binding protein [Gemmatimonadetes bacterium]|nr:ABC transporter ATP-binding protein [Gemmatimonadota bacterium]
MSDHPGRMVFDRVWKKFHRGAVHDSLRDLIPAMVGRILGRARPEDVGLSDGDFWAVRDLSFEVGPGQCLGIIGPNGSGKSTTLKLLTRIYAPTRGQTAIFGRVGTLIEISAGFHGDLTGRENVFLQGSIMGMRIKEVARKFDEIVEFSGISEFIDTPVKRYSSGMNARLGFSIAAHLEPDVLVIDEVLAVGDLSFQQKAFGRIRDMTRSGIPVIMVSHQLERVAELCSHVLVLRRGEVVAQGEATDAIAAYVQQQGTEAPALEGGPVRFDTLKMHSDLPVNSGAMFGVRLEGAIVGEITERIDPLVLRIRSLRSGQILYIVGSVALGVEVPKTGAFAADLTFQANVPAGNYLVEVVAVDIFGNKELSSAPPALFRVVEPTTFRGTVQMNPTVQLVAK